MDWLRLLDDHRIEYVTRGPNTKRGEVSIRCPWCGEDDPSQHLGINLKTERWGCLRDATHRGNTTPRLIAALLGCSTLQAKAVQRQYNTPDPDNLDEALAMLTGNEDEKVADEIQKDLAMLDEFQVISCLGPTKRFWDYLERRGFDDVRNLCGRYSLRCANTGIYKDRIIIPIYQKQRLIGWTGRAIADPKNAPRYLSSSGAIKNAIFNEDELSWGGEILFITEGPFDAMKLDFYGAQATCLFGATPTTEQIAILAELSSSWDKIVILMDPDAIGASFHLSDWLNARNVVIGQVPEGVKDPGDMTREQIAILAGVYAKS